MTNQNATDIEESTGEAGQAEGSYLTVGKFLQEPPSEDAEDAEDATAQRPAVTAVPVDLTLKIWSEDGSCTEFYQKDPAIVDRTLKLLITPRLFSQSVLTLASEQGVSVIPLRAVGVIEAHTLAPTQLLLPAGLLEVTEVGGEEFDDDAAELAETNRGEQDLQPETNTTTSHIEIRILGGWGVILRVKSIIQPTVHDQRLQLTHLFEVPIIAFFLETGGIGFINPAKINRVSASHGLNSVPERALSAALLRSTPRWHRSS